MAKLSFTTILALSCLFCLQTAVAQTQTKPRAVFVLFSVTPSITMEETGDMVEALHFKLAKEHGVEFVPKEHLYTNKKVGYISPRKTGNCVYDYNCMREVRTTYAKLKWFVIGTMHKRNGGIELVVTRIDSEAKFDRTTTVVASSDFADLSSKALAATNEVIQKRKATVIVNVSPSDATIELNGAPVKHGLATQVKPGEYLMIASKDGYQPLRQSISLVEGQQLVVPVTLDKIEIKVPVPLPIIEPDNDTSTILIGSGWGTFGVGLVFTAIGVVKVIDADSIEEELEEACATTPCSISRNDAESKNNAGASARSIAKWSIPLGISLAVAGAATAIVGHAIREKPYTRKGAGIISWNVTPIVSSDHVGLTGLVRF